MLTFRRKTNMEMRAEAIYEVIKNHLHEKHMIDWWRLAVNGKLLPMYQMSNKQFAYIARMFVLKRMLKWTTKKAGGSTFSFYEVRKV